MKKILTLTLCCLTTCSGVALAQPAMTPEQAAQQAQSRHGGRVLNVRPTPNSDGSAPGYRVKLLDKGEVRTVTVPKGKNKGKGKGKGKGKKDNKRARPNR